MIYWWRDIGANRFSGVFSKFCIFTGCLPSRGYRYGHIAVAVLVYYALRSGAHTAGRLYWLVGVPSVDCNLVLEPVRFYICGSQSNRIASNRAEHIWRAIRVADYLRPFSSRGPTLPAIDSISNIRLLGFGSALWGLEHLCSDCHGQLVGQSPRPIRICSWERSRWCCPWWHLWILVVEI
jgi:hypothetical protein